MATPTVLVSSLGLMGGSLAAALHSKQWQVLLHHRRPEVAEQAEQLGYGEAITNIDTALEQSDIVVVCSPVSVIAGTISSWAARHPRPTFTDVGSVKGLICRALINEARAGRYVGSHPMAGSHLSGLAHADPHLYDDCVTAITPIPETPATSITLIEQLWHAVGSRTRRYTPDDHDRAVAIASHLPHIMAAATASLLDEQAAPMAANGFRDSTRVAGADPTLWTDILRGNRDAVLNVLRSAQTSLAEIEKAIDQQDSEALTKWLTTGLQGRRRFEHFHGAHLNDRHGEESH